MCWFAKFGLKKILAVLTISLLARARMLLDKVAGCISACWKLFLFPSSITVRSIATFILCSTDALITIEESEKLHSQFLLVHLFHITIYTEFCGTVAVSFWLLKCLFSSAEVCEKSALKWCKEFIFECYDLIGYKDPPDFSSLSISCVNFDQILCILVDGLTNINDTYIVGSMTSE